MYLALAIITAIGILLIALVASALATIFISYALGIIEGSKAVYIFVSILLTLIAGISWILQKVVAELILEWMGLG